MMAEKRNGARRWRKRVQPMSPTADNYAYRFRDKKEPEDPLDVAFDEKLNEWEERRTKKIKEWEERMTADLQEMRKEVQERKSRMNVMFLTASAFLAGDK